MKFHVWIASHFHIQLRVEWFEKCIKSIADQTKKPDVVMISYSKAEDVDINVEKLFKKHLCEIEYKIYFHSERKSQFQHLKYIYDNLNKNIDRENNWICFCDDDDMYHPQRIAYLNYTLQILNTDALIDKSYIIDEDDVIINSMSNDFANNSLRLSLLDKFWVEKNLALYSSINKHTVDLFFSTWINKYTSSLFCVLYYKRCTPYILNTRSWHHD